MSASRIRCDIDFAKHGKRVSFLAVPNSTNESAYGTVTIPIAVISHGAGPTLFLSGGVHGDEYEGPVALMHMARNLQPKQIQGRVMSKSSPQTYSTMIHAGYRIESCAMDCSSILPWGDSV